MITQKKSGTGSAHKHTCRHMVCRKQFHVRMRQKRTKMVTNNCLRRKSVGPQICTIEVERRNVCTWTSSLFLCGSAHLAGLTWVSASCFWICLACRSSSLFSGMVCAIWFYQNDLLHIMGPNANEPRNDSMWLLVGPWQKKFTGEPTQSIFDWTKSSERLNFWTFQVAIETWNLKLFSSGRFFSIEFSLEKQNWRLKKRLKIRLKLNLDMSKPLKVSAWG